jgi:hypothetical protein
MLIIKHCSFLQGKKSSALADGFQETLSISIPRASAKDALHRLPPSLDRYPSLKKLVTERLQQNMNDDIETTPYHYASCDERRINDIASTEKNETNETYMDKKSHLDTRSSMNCHGILAQEATLCPGSNTLDDRQHVAYFLEDLKRAREERRKRLLKSCKAFTA